MKVPLRFTFPAVCLLVLAACSRGSGPATAAETEPAAETTTAHALTLDAGQRERIGIATSRAAESSFLAETPGYGVVLGHETIAVASAEVATAQAAARQSHATLTRARGLASTPGALPVESAEAAERQSAVDDAALMLAQRRLSALLGQRAPVHAGESTLLSELATGHVKLVSASFPLGALPASLPKRLRLARLDGSGARGWNGNAIWEAPADASIPGRRLFTMLRTDSLDEGERLQVWAATGASIKGAMVPASAVIQSNGAYWCYIEKPPGSYARVAIDIGRPVTGGYFVSAGVAAGDSVVTSGAGLLLAHEANPGTGSEE